MAEHLLLGISITLLGVFLMYLFPQPITLGIGFIITAYGMFSFAHHYILDQHNIYKK